MHESRRRIALHLLAASSVALAACAGRRPTGAASPDVELGASAGYRCAYRKLQDLGYSITRTMPEHGSVTGERITSAPRDEATRWDVLEVAAPIGPHGRGKVRVRVRGGEELAGRRATRAPSPHGTADGKRIEADCSGARN